MFEKRNIRPVLRMAHSGMVRIGGDHTPAGDQ
jgi:hypothetical protein